MIHLCKHWAVILSAICAALTSVCEKTHAQACSGLIEGRFTHAQRGGHWCDENFPWQGAFDCTGSLYPVSEVTRGILPGDQAGNAGLPEVPFLIRNTGGTVIASGVTDDDGNFSVTWTDTSNGCSGDISATMEVGLVHPEGRFNLVWGPIYPLEPWEYWGLYTQEFEFSRQPVTSGLTAAWGSWDAPHLGTNIYTAALKTWNNALSLSGRMLESFLFVSLVYPNRLPCAGTATGCATCPADFGSTIYLGATAALDTWTIAHELGHAAMCAAHTPDYIGSADGSRDGPGHTPTSEEYRSLTFLEGWADFVAGVALWSPNNAVHPRMCLGANGIGCTWHSFHSECLDHSFDFSNPCSSSNPDSSRQEATVAAYLWDLVDTRSDSSGVFTETADGFFFETVDTLASFPQGSANGAENEHICCVWFWCGPCENWRRDAGHNAEDFSVHWLPRPIGNAWDMNCTP